MQVSFLVANQSFPDARVDLSILIGDMVLIPSALFAHMLQVTDLLV